jgi:hypothetical protein
MRSKPGWGIHNHERDIPKPRGTIEEPQERAPRSKFSRREVGRDLSNIISCGRNAKSLYELHFPPINTSHDTFIMLTYSADHEPAKEWLSENEIEPDVEEGEEQVGEENEEMEVVEEGEHGEEELENIVVEEMEQAEEKTEETIVVEEAAHADEEPESITTALLYYPDPKNSQILPPCQRRS